MKKNVSLKITSSQYVENLKPSGEAFVRELELEDSIEIQTEGTLYSKNNAVYIIYDESEEAGLMDLRTMLKLTQPQTSANSSADAVTYPDSDEATDLDSQALFFSNPAAQSLQIRRYGKGAQEDDMEMVLQQGVLNVTRYRLPHLGSMNLEIYTHSLSGDLDSEGYGTISVDYKIKFDQFYSRRNKLEVEVKPT